MDKVLNNLGLVMRARHIICGEHLVVEAIRNGNCSYIFLASDAGLNTSKKIKDKASYYNVLVNDCYTSQELSKAIGKENIKTLAVDKKGSGFVKILRK